jgi:hypothetical protein
MPRKDRTFSDRDMERLILHYLTRPEKIKVLEFFGLGLDVPELPPAPTPEKRKINKVKIEVQIAQKTIERIVSLLEIAELFPGPQRTPIAAIKKLLGALLTILTTIDTILQ